MGIQTFYHQLISSNLDLDESDIALKKVRLINFILLLGIPINAIFIYFNLIHHQFLFAGFNLLTVLFMSFSFFYLRGREDHIYTVGHMTILAMFFVYFPTLLQGGIANSGFVWFFLFPLFAIFLTGDRAGLKWLLLLFFFITITYIFSDKLDLPYTPDYLIYLLLALIVETFYVLFSHNIQTRYEADLADKNHLLEKLTNNLKNEVAKQVAITRGQDHILTQQSKMASVGEMMGYISHQWKQPLSAINVIVQNVQIAEALEKDGIEITIDDAWESILTQTSLLSSTMQEFLHFSRPDKEKIFSIKNALGILKQLVGGDFHNHNILLNIGNINETHLLYGKENEFVHAVMNIVNNAKDILIQRAIKEPRLDLNIKGKEGRIELFICDNAGGIEESVLPHIFDAYFSTKLDNGGTGLGLHMSQRIITEHLKGELSVSNTEQGACFLLSFTASSKK